MRSRFIKQLHPLAHAQYATFNSVQRLSPKKGASDKNSHPGVGNIVSMVMPHPPRLVVGGDYEGDLTPAACPWGGACALFGESLLWQNVHLSGPDLMKEITPVERNSIIALFKSPITPPPPFLPAWEVGA